MKRATKRGMAGRIRPSGRQFDTPVLKVLFKVILNWVSPNNCSNPTLLNIWNQSDFLLILLFQNVFIKSTTTKKTKTNQLGTANDNKNPYVTKVNNKYRRMIQPRFRK